MMELHHFYHLWVGGKVDIWQKVVEEHFRGLRESGLLAQLTTVAVGLVGSASQRQVAKEYLTRMVPQATIVIEAPRGYEQLTLNAIREFVQEHDGYLLYAHNKGCYNNYIFNGWWRRSMMHYLGKEWQRAISGLTEHEVVGCHWLRAREYSMIETKSTPETVKHQHIAGNFWWARCDYLRTLRYPLHDDRFDAEWWIGHNTEVRVRDLNPGWPHESIFKLNRNG